MKTLAFIISDKENENRRALVPDHIANIRNKDRVFIETGYGNVLGLPDKNYTDLGLNVCSREEALTKDIICDPKVGDAEYLKILKHQTIFGWIHAVQNRAITDTLIDKHLTVYAWEDMFEKGRHVFYRNNEIAGEASIMHAFQCHGIFPYGLKVAVLGRGNVAMGAIKALHYLGANVTVFDRRTEKTLRDNIGNYDVFVNAILWDTTRKDHIIYRSDLNRMKQGALIIDISCDRAGGVETSVPTTIEQPDYLVDGIRHYVVDHTPSLFWKTSTFEISAQASRFFDFLIEDNAISNKCLSNALAIEEGKIKDQRINQFQHR